MNESKSPNRKERRKTAAIAKKTKPLARLGVPIFTSILRVVLAAPDGPQTRFYWRASETDPNEFSEQELMAAAAGNGPFNTAAEAEEAARRATIGPDCQVTEGGTWDQAWEKPQ